MEERKMSHEVFGQLLDELEGDGTNVLKEKNGRYSAPDDALHNFRAGANFTGLTPAQTCWGYMSKHLIALKDMVDRNDFSNREDFLEKCKDPINYLRILWAIGNDEEYWKNRHAKVDVSERHAFYSIAVYNKSNNELAVKITAEEKPILHDDFRDVFAIESYNRSGDNTLRVWSKNDYYYLFNLRKEDKNEKQD